MKYNIIEYVKKPSFIIVSVLYLIFFVFTSIDDYSKYTSSGINIHYYLFSSSLGLFLTTDYPKAYILTNIISSSLPKLIFFIYIFLTYYQFSFNMDSTYIFLRTSRKKKFLKYIFEAFLLFIIVYTILVVFQMVIMNSRYQVRYDWGLILINLVNSLIFYLFFIIVMSILQLLLNDWYSATITFILLIIFSHGNYFFSYQNLLRDENFDNIFNKFIPTYMDIIYYHNITYGILYFILTILLIVLNLKLFLRTDISIEVIK